MSGGQGCRTARTGSAQLGRELQILTTTKVEYLVEEILLKHVPTSAPGTPSLF